MIINDKRELWITRFCLSLTIGLLFGLFYYIAERACAAYAIKDIRALIDVAIFTFVMAFMAYGGILYQICLLNYYTRRLAYLPASREELETMYEGNAPSLSVIIPSYKEELAVIRQTMLSAALSEYPEKNVVLLIDDPYHPRAREDAQALEAARMTPVRLQKLFDAPLQRFTAEKEAFAERRAQGSLNYPIELNRLSLLYDEVAAWLDAQAEEIRGGKALKSLAHSDRFFIDNILLAPARRHEMLAETLRERMTGDEAPSSDYLARQYARLAGLFNVRFSSFERKKYANLSHEANKAMNLNSYISLMGKSWKEMETQGGEKRLQMVQQASADFSIPSADYIITLDADSVVLGEYALRLAHLMQKPENRKLGVIQSPVSAFPNCPGGIERAAGACMDLQFPMHQGYTHWNATFWVGASAMLRFRALGDIEEVREERGYPISVFIQDRTVIEDTESSIHLVHRGWQLFNYPERMTFSATPPDFGSLLIQRRRWANGGLIILPVLFKYVLRAPKSVMLMKEFFMRFHYLASTTIGCASALLYFFYPFGSLASTLWFPLSTLPFLILYIRSLRHTGYTMFDAFRIFSLNLMLFPVLIGGVLKQFQQMITGRKIPFGRTPKVTNRTAAPALYCLIALMLPAFSLYGVAINLEHRCWVDAMLAALNGGLFAYALFRLIGVRAAMEDFFAGMKIHAQDMLRFAEKLPVTAMQWLSDALPADRERA